MMFKLINPWLLVAVLVLLGGTYAKGRYDGSLAEQAAEAARDVASDKVRKENESKLRSSTTSYLTQRRLLENENRTLEGAAASNPTATAPALPSDSVRRLNRIR